MKEVGKEEDTQRMMGNGASEEALAIQSQDEEPLGRAGSGSREGWSRTSLPCFVLRQTLMLGYTLENEHPPNPWTRPPGGVETWSGPGGRR